jgi:hypothetical protein
MRCTVKRFSYNAINFFQFFHQVEAGVKSTGSIYDSHIRFPCDGSLHGIKGNCAGISPELPADHR